MARRKLTNRNTQEKRKIRKMEQRPRDVVLMMECIEDAKIIVREKRLMESQSSIVYIAIALFENRKDKK